MESASLMVFAQEVLRYLYNNISLIPFSISFGAAILLTAMYLASYVSSTLLKMLLIPAWLLSIVTYFFPSLIPKEYEVASLVIFGVMVGAGALAMKIRSKRLGKARVEKALIEIVEWMETSQILDPNLSDNKRRIIKYGIKRILKRNKVI
ncbi:TPA: hypothetical protein EYP26_04665 [Candidatus Bathyarchaeota archaeon]|nr:hypothetical protein [Candidatus Bathyarchaeota archaeon]